MSKLPTPEESISKDSKSRAGASTVSIGTTVFKNGDESRSSSEECYGTWELGDASSVNVRIGPNYHKNKQKAPSEHAIYETIAMDLYSLPKKAWHFARYIEIPATVTPDASLLQAGNQEEKKTSSNNAFELPEFFVTVVLVPSYSPGIFMSYHDGEGVVCILVQKLSEEAKRRIAENDVTPAMKLLRKFMDTVSTDKQMRGRMKGIVRTSNLEEINFNPLLSGLANRYNGTPFLIHHNEAKYFTGANYFEMDVDMHSWGVMTRNALYQLFDIMPRIKAQYSFVVEGRSDDELPEQVISVTEVSGIRNTDCLPFPIDISNVKDLE